MTNKKKSNIIIESQILSSSRLTGPTEIYVFSPSQWAHLDFPARKNLSTFECYDRAEKIMHFAQDF